MNGTLELQFVGTCHPGVVTGQASPGATSPKSSLLKAPTRGAIADAPVSGDLGDRRAVFYQSPRHLIHDANTSSHAGRKPSQAIARSTARSRRDLSAAFWAASSEIGPSAA